MIDQALQLSFRLVVTGFLFLLILISLAGVRSLWTTRTIALETFRFLSKESASEEKGKHFTLLLLKDIHRLKELYSMHEGEYALIPSADQIGRAEQLNLLTIKESDLPNVEISTHGVQITAVLRPLERFFSRGEEVEGTVAKEGDKFDAFAEIRGTHAVGSRIHWYVSDSNSLEELSFKLASRIFRLIAARDEPLFEKISDEDFEILTRAVESYEKYRMTRQQEPRSKQFVGDRKSGIPLAESLRLLNVLLEGSCDSPLVYKLSAYIYKEMGNLREADSALEHYLNSLQGKSLGADARAVTLLKEIRSLAHVRVGTASDDHLVQPGISIGPAEREIRGTICCLVKDQANFVYALTSPYLFWFSGGTKGLLSQEAQSGSGPAKYSIGVVSKATEDPSGGLLVKINDGLAISAEVRGSGAFAGLSNDVKLGESLTMIGAASDKVEGKVLAITIEEVISTRIANKGDTGAPVLNQRGELIGMVWGGNGERTFITRVSKVLEDLDVKLVSSKADAVESPR